MIREIRKELLIRDKMRVFKFTKEIGNVVKAYWVFEVPRLLRFRIEWTEWY